MDLFQESLTKKSSLSYGQHGLSTPRPDHFGRKAMLCTFYYQRGVIWHELLKPGETVTGARYSILLVYHQQLTELEPCTQSSVKYLGVGLHPKLTYSAQIQQATIKASQSTASLSRLIANIFETSKLENVLFIFIPLFSCCQKYRQCAFYLQVYIGL